MSVSPLPESRPILSQMPSDPELERLSEVFKIFSDNSRLRIIAALLEKELCVYDLTQALGMTQSAVSHQLRLLRNAHLSRPAGKAKASFTAWMTTMSSPL